MRFMDLFAGIGGISLGLQRAGMTPVAFAEKDPFCQRVLHKHWSNVPCYEDVRDVTKERLEQDGIRNIELISGGFPCQPFSTSGERIGAEDDRYLWAEMLRVIREVEPRWVFGENVAGIINMELDTVLSGLEASGYSAGAFVIPACAVDAKHRRDRVWILAHSSRERQQGSWQPFHASNQKAHGEGKTTHVVDGCVERKWSAEPGLGRVAYGVPDRMDRLTGLGNAVVPQVVEVLGNFILEQERGKRKAIVNDIEKSGTG